MTRAKIITIAGVDQPDFLIVRKTPLQVGAPIEAILEETPGHPGAFLIGENIKARPLPFEVAILADNDEDLKAKADQLFDWAYNEKAQPLSYTDQPGKTFYAKLEGSGEFDKLAAYGEGTLTFICPDPYKYDTETTANDSLAAGVAKDITITNDGRAATPATITATFTGAGDNFTVTGPDGKQIKVIRTFSAGQILEIETGKLKITLNGQTIMPSLAIASRKILLQKGDNVINFNSGAAANIEIQYRKRGL